MPRKNVALLQGKPLLAYAIEAATKSNIFNEVYVSSEDEEILKCAENYSATPLHREEDLATDTAQVRDVTHRVLKQLAHNGLHYGTFGVTLVTNPLRNEEDIRKAYEIFQETDCDGVMSLIQNTHPPQRAVWAPDGFIKPYFGHEFMKQTQLLDKTYRHDGSIYFGKTSIFLGQMEFYGNRIAPYFTPLSRAIDIDTAEDLEMAEAILRIRQNE